MKTMVVIKLNTEMEAATAALWWKPKYKDLPYAISKTYFQQQQQESAYLLKERSLFTAGTQISGLAEQVEKYFKAQSK